MPRNSDLATILCGQPDMLDGVVPRGSTETLSNARHRETSSDELVAVMVALAARPVARASAIVGKGLGAITMDAVVVHVGFMAVVELPQ